MSLPIPLESKSRVNVVELSSGSKAVATNSVVEPNVIAIVCCGTVSTGASLTLSIPTLAVATLLVLPSSVNVTSISRLAVEGFCELLTYWILRKAN